MKVISMIGLPGAGKSTTANSLQKQGYNLITELPYSKLYSVFSIFAPKITYRLMGFPYYRKFSKDYDVLIQFVMEMSREYTPTKEECSRVREWYIHDLIIPYSRAKYSHFDETVVIDEGFQHRATTMFVSSNVKRQVPVLEVERYCKLIPKPEILIHVEEDISTCIQRLNTRESGWPKQAKNLNRSKKEEFIRNYDACIEMVIDNVRSNGIKIITVNKDTDVRSIVDQIESKLK